MLAVTTKRVFAAGFIALAAIAFSNTLLPHAVAQNAAGENASCEAEDFSREVDAAGEALRSFNASMSPELDKKLQSLKAAKGWSDDNFRELAQDYLFDARTAALDQKANALLSKLDELGSSGERGGADCAKLAELKATGAELLAVMKTKSSLTLARIDEEIAASRGGSSGADRDRQAALRLPEPDKDDLLGLKPGLDTGENTDRAGASGSSPRTGGQPAAGAPPKTAKPAEPAKPQPRKPKADRTAGREETKPSRPIPARPPAGTGPATEGWSATTQLDAQGPDAGAAPPQAAGPQAPGDLALNTPPPTIEDWNQQLPPPDSFAGPEEGYTVEEIRDATRGFFGTISTNLAAVLEHAFSNWGRPTAYVLGYEGGGAFLAGLRYGKGQLYMRSGLSAQVYWHGPSLGYDFGAEGSRTMFLIYSLRQPDDLYRRYTGVDGSAYLVGGVGVTLLKGGPVILAPIRSGVGLRLGANIGYVRFSPEPTWNPF